MCWYSVLRSLKKTNRHRRATSFLKPRRPQIQGRPGKVDGEPCLPSIFHQRTIFKRMQQVTHHVSKLRYPKSLVNSSLNKVSQEPDKYTGCLQQTQNGEISSIKTKQHMTETQKRSRHRGQQDKTETLRAKSKSKPK